MRRWPYDSGCIILLRCNVLLLAGLLLITFPRVATSLDDTAASCASAPGTIYRAIAATGGSSPIQSTSLQVLLQASASRQRWDGNDNLNVGMSDGTAGEATSFGKPGSAAEDAIVATDTPRFGNGSLPSNSTPNVSIALFLNDLDQVHVRTEQWVGDVVMHMRYRKADFDNTTVVSAEFFDCRVDRVEDGRRWEENGFVTELKHMYVTAHYTGDYTLFPFDRHELILVAHLKGLSAAEARLVPWPTDGADTVAVRQDDELVGKSVHTPQFYITGAEFKIALHREPGTYYFKSIASLHFFVDRRKMTEMLIGWVIPSLAFCFALLAFYLPVNLIVPRVTVSFTSFLAMFVHVKQVASILPDGVWCWLLTSLVFNLTMLSTLIMANVAAARLGPDPRSSQIDLHIRTRLPIEYVFGQVFLLCARYYHMYVGPLLVIAHGVVHIYLFARLHEDTDVAADVASTESHGGVSKAPSALRGSTASQRVGACSKVPNMPPTPHFAAVGAMQSAPLAVDAFSVSLASMGNTSDGACSLSQSSFVSSNPTASFHERRRLREDGDHEEGVEGISGAPAAGPGGGDHGAGGAHGSDAHAAHADHAMDVGGDDGGMM